jgi:hypothetical protein
VHYNYAVPVFPNRSGISILSVLIASAMVASGMVLFLSSLSSSQGRINSAKQKAMVAASAAELLEYFRSLSSVQLNNYLQTNPVTRSTAAAQRYSLCSGVNVLNRSTGGVSNPDPLANTGDGPLQLNRFYSVQVVDSVTLAARPAACGTKAPYNFAASPTDRFLVSVGVSWMPIGKTEPELFSLSVILP